MKLLYTLCSILILTALAAPLCGQNWTGNTDSDWNNSANWSDWPLDGEDIVIDPTFYTGAMAQPNVTGNSVFSPAEVLIQNGGVLTLSADLTTEDDVEVIGVGSAINVNSGIFEVNFFDGGRLIFALGAAMTMDGGTVSVGERFIAGEDALITINDGAANSLERWLMDAGGKCIQNGGTVTAGQVFAMGDGSLMNDSGYELHGGTLNITGEMAFENELGLFEPTFLMTGGELNVTGDVVWFGEGPGSGTPRFIMNGGTALVDGSVMNLPVSTVNMFLHIDEDAAFNLSNGTIDQSTPTDSIVQTGTSQLTLENVVSVNITGAFYATGGTSTITASTNLIGFGSVQFNDLFIGTGATLTHQAPPMIQIFGDFNMQGSFDPIANAVEFNGSSGQFIQGGGIALFSELVISNSSAEGVVMQLPVHVGAHLQLNDGLLNSSPVNMLTLVDDATANMGGGESFVNGPLTKVGDEAFVFPIGNTDRWARLSITAPNNATTEFTAQYFNTAYDPTEPVNAPLDAVSDNEYWSLETNDPAAEVGVALFWEDATFSEVDCGNVTMARWNDTDWNEIPSSSTGDCFGVMNGSVTSQEMISDFGILTLGYFAPVGIEDNGQVSFQTFPNPTEGNITIQLDRPYSDLVIQLMDVTGKQVLEDPFNGTSQFSVDMEHLPAGIYLLKLISDSGVSSQRVVKR